MTISYETVVFIGQIFLSAVLGGIIGIERDIHGRAAGLRTHILVGSGATLFMIISQVVASRGNTPIGSDPGRIAAQIVTGIGFLGAGAIMKEGFNVRGLTTAACFWVVAAIGMSVGAGQYILAISTTIMSLLTLSVLNHVDKFYKRDSYREISIKIPVEIDSAKIIEAVKGDNIKIIFVDFEKNYETNTKTIIMTLRLFHDGTTDKISQRIVDSLESINVCLKSISWTHGKLH